MDLQNLQPARQIRIPEHDLPIEPTRPEERADRESRAIGGRQDDDRVLGPVEAVHLGPALI